MPYKHPELQSNAPYYDDFEETKNFLKVLFKPGYAVQARELTQVQSILQSQLSRFADHIFLDGSQVLGGNVNVSPVNFVRVQRFLANSDGTLTTTTTDSYLQSIIKTQTSYDNTDLQTNQILGTVEKKQIEVYKFDPDTSTYGVDPFATILLLHYSGSGYSSTDNFTVLHFMSITGTEDGIGVNDLLKIKNEDVYFKIINPSLDENTGIYAVPPYGTSSIVSVDDGIFYIDGMFVKNYNQLLVPYYDSTNSQNNGTNYSEDGQLYDISEAGVRLFTYPSVRVGLTVNKTTVTATTDTTLRDPASGFYNANAPGADRYKINLVLSQLQFDPESVDVDNYSNSNFIQVVRLVNGKADWIRRLPNYSQILELFARRTYDESGSYTVRPFQVQVKNHYRNDYYEVVVLNSPDDLKIGSMVYSDIGTTNPQNLFNSGFDFSPYAVLEVTSLEPYSEISTVEGIEADAKLVKMRPKGAKRLSFNINASPQGYGSLSFVTKDLPVGTILVKLKSYNIDPDGTYSAQDIPSGDLSKMVLSVEPGKAYVYGYEYENYYPKNVDYLKKDIESIVEQDLAVDAYNLLGNYVVGSFAQDTTAVEIPWERLPKFKLNSDTLFILVMEQGENLSAESPILSWSPYKLWTSDSTKYIKGITDTSRKYESVIFVQDTL
jgi:hypothetical protein